MFCTFFGHRDSPEKIKHLLKKTILSIIEKEGVRDFLVGNNGNFDLYAQCILQEFKNDGMDIRFNIIISRIDEKSLIKKQDATLFPEELEESIAKFRISKRNEWLIKKSSYIIAYVTRKYSNSSCLIETASKKGLRIINIADYV